MKANINLITPEDNPRPSTTEKLMEGLKSNSTLIGREKSSRTYWSLTLFFSFIIVLGVGYIFGITDLLESSSVENKDYRAEELANKNLVEQQSAEERDRLKADEETLKVDEAAPEEAETEVETATDETTETQPEKHESEPVGEEF